MVEGIEAGLVVNGSLKGVRRGVTRTEKCEGEIHGERAEEGLCDRYKWYSV